MEYLNLREVSEAEVLRVSGAFEREGKQLALISVRALLRVLHANPALSEYLLQHSEIASGSECGCTQGTRRLIQLDALKCARCGRVLAS